jgi:hypothetical protein
MRIVTFPQRHDVDADGSLAELEAALHGQGQGPAADSWRELREDVRALAPPMDPELEQRLRERIAERAAAKQRRRRRSWTRSPIGHARQRLGTGRRTRIIAGLAAGTVAAAIAALVVIAPWQGSGPPMGEVAAFNGPARPAAGGGASKGGVVTQLAPSVKHASSSAGTAGAQSSAPSSTATTQSSPPAAGPSEPAPARVQQQAASITLAATPENVQSIADRVARLAVNDGGFVQSSQVHLQPGSAGEASLTLRLPSGRLSAALASLAQLAPMRAENQSLQDITDEYGAARRNLADATAERRALLRALSRASTQGQIESLRQRLSLAGGAIARARTALQKVSERAGSSAVEVTVLGDAHASGGGLTLSRGLHDAGDVLRVALVVLIIAAAALVPLAMLLALLTFGWRASRRHLRERALS